DVARADQVASDLDRAMVFQVERQALLSLIVLVEVAGAIDAGLTIRPRWKEPRDADPAQRLDADHLGPEVCELQGTERARPHPGEVGDAYALDRPAGSGLGAHPSSPACPARAVTRLPARCPGAAGRRSLRLRSRAHRAPDRYAHRA